VNHCYVLMAFIEGHGERYLCLTGLTGLIFEAIRFCRQEDAEDVRDLLTKAPVMFRPTALSLQVRRYEP